MPPKYRKCRDCSKNGYDECLCRFCQKCGFTGHTEDRCIAELHYRCKQVHEPGKCPQGKPPDAEPEPKDADADKLDDSLGHITYASGSDTAEQDPHDTSLDWIEGWDSLPSDTESELEVSRLQPRRAEICSPAEPQSEKVLTLRKEQDCAELQEFTGPVQGIPFCLENLGVVNRAQIFKTMLSRVRSKYANRYRPVLDMDNLEEVLEGALSPAIREMCESGRFTLERYVPCPSHGRYLVLMVEG